MATKVSGNFGFSGQALIRALRKKTPRREKDANFIGLQRSLSLSDLSDPQKSLNNLLEKISAINVAERIQYGRPFNSVDWDVTKNFIFEDISRTSLSSLKGSSVTGSLLGSTISINPRIRIQDRLSFLNSFYGEGSFPSLHSGPDAQFYKEPPIDYIGDIKFTFNDDPSFITISELKEPNSDQNLILGPILPKDQTYIVVFNLDQYTTPDGVTVSLNGLRISLRLYFDGTWGLHGQETRNNLIRIDDATRVNNESIFNTLKFKITRPYSFKYKPLWFTQSPNDPTLPGSADDLNPSTTNRIIRSEFGNIFPYVEKGYWYSRAYINNRWTEEERERLNLNGPTIVEDSNMRWIQPPSALRSQTYNWGIRWDGYLRLTPGIYAFEVQTNVAVKIDMAIASGGSWLSVFDTESLSAQESEEVYVSSSFDTETVSSRYKYFTTETDWVGYVPITIRMYHGGPDKAYPSQLITSEPNLFIKTTSLSSPVNFYSKEYDISLNGSNENWTITGPNIGNIISILEDINSNVTYSLTKKGGNLLAVPISINLQTDGTTISSNTNNSELTVSVYTLTISPNRPSGFNENLQSLWKSRIASPSDAHQSYSDLTDGSYEPNIYKVGFDSRSTWWKVSEGSPYIKGGIEPVSLYNTPLDGFIANTFKGELKSYAEGVGLYGDESGNYSTRPNIILGEARYSTNDELGSNYIGLRLTPNLLGEGGKLNIRALPVNSTLSDDDTILGVNDLGGSPNHLTIAQDKIQSEKIRLFLSDISVADTSVFYNKYYTVYITENFNSMTDSSVVYFYNSNFYGWNGTSHVVITHQSDNPESYGLPPFDNDLAWQSPITVTVSRVADDINFEQGVKPLTAVLTFTVEKVTIGGLNFLSFSTTQPSLLRASGEDIALFSGKYIEFYTEQNVAFQYVRVDDGRSLSFPDVLKLTYDENNEFQGFFSEVPRPPSDRVTPFGFDKTLFSTGICYPPYVIENPLLSKIAIEDDDLYNQPVGNYDTFWGNPEELNLGGNTLELTEKIEFQNWDGNAVESFNQGVYVGNNIVNSVPLSYEDYTHRFKIEMPLPPGQYDDDMLIYIGNGEKVRDSYYAYVKL